MLIDWSHNKGDYISEDIYSDLDLEKLDAIPPQNLHRPVDLLFLESDKEGKFVMPASDAVAWSLIVTLFLLPRLHAVGVDVPAHDLWRA